MWNAAFGLVAKESLFQHQSQIEILFGRPMEVDARGLIAAVHAAHVEIVHAAELLLENPP